MMGGLGVVWVKQGLDISLAEPENLESLERSCVYRSTCKLLCLRWLIYNFFIPASLNARSILC